jgi:hypothetical protein
MLINKRDFYLTLCTDFIDVELIEERGKSLVAERNFIEEKVKRIYEINPDSPKCPILANMFLEYFDVQGRSLKTFTQGKDNLK